MTEFTRHFGHLRTRATVFVACAAVLAPIALASPSSARTTPRAACVIALVADSYSTPKDTPLTVSDPGVRSNDQICQADGLMISTSQPSHGSLSNFDDFDGGFTYTPNAGFVGTDSFMYTLEDVHDIPPVTVTITVTGQATTTTTVAPTTTTVVSTTAPASTSTTAVATQPQSVPAKPVTVTPTFTG